MNGRARVSLRAAGCGTVRGAFVSTIAILHLLRWVDVFRRPGRFARGFLEEGIGTPCAGTGDRRLGGRPAAVSNRPPSVRARGKNALMEGVNGPRAHPRDRWEASHYPVHNSEHELEMNTSCIDVRSTWTERPPRWQTTRQDPFQGTWSRPRPAASHRRSRERSSCRGHVAGGCRPSHADDQERHIATKRKRHPREHHPQDDSSATRSPCRRPSTSASCPGDKAAAPTP